MVAPPREAPPPRGAMVPASLRVLGRRRDTADTWTLELETAGVGGALHFRPGQFTMLGAAGRGEVPVSISGDPCTGYSVPSNRAQTRTVDRSLLARTIC